MQIAISLLVVLLQKGLLGQFVVLLVELEVVLATLDLVLQLPHLLAAQGLFQGLPIARVLLQHREQKL